MTSPTFTCPASSRRSLSPRLPAQSPIEKHRVVSKTATKRGLADGRMPVQGGQRLHGPVRADFQHDPWHLLALDLCRRTLRDNAAPVDEGEPVAMLRLVHVMGRYHDRGPLFGEPVDEV